MMKSIKKIFSSVLAVVFSVTLCMGMPTSVSASAESISVEEPNVQGFADSKKNQYKDSLFFVGEYYDAENDYTLNYRYYTPQDMSEKVPLIIFLHGRGERGSDNDSQLNNAILRPFIEDEDSKFYGAMVIAPQCPVKEYNNGWVELFSDNETANSLAYKNYSVDSVEESNECKAIVSLIKDTCSKSNVDPNRVYLIGLSQGAVATWDLLARHRDMFAAAVPIAGVGDVSKAEIYADIPIYAFHGNADTTVAYATATPKMYEAINAVGKNNMHFVTFTDAPHAIWEAAIVYKGNEKMPGLEEWLFSQTRATEVDVFQTVVEQLKETLGCNASLDNMSLLFVFVPAIVVGNVLVSKKRKYQ